MVSVTTEENRDTLATDSPARLRAAVAEGKRGGSQRVRRLRLAAPPASRYTLVLLRHAKARQRGVFAFGTPEDRARPLARRGCKEARHLINEDISK